ncbi:MAG: hypothetical protein JO215_12660, partial [Ktedonobacteraceae bacterium]|nr:hypothetical protein [Ktedonobacteraceae bacterium]
ATWSADSNKVITLDSSISSGGLAFWNWRESKPQPHALGAPDQDRSVTFSVLAGNPASTTPCFATGNDNGEVSLWNAIAEALPIKTLDNGGIAGPVVAMAWSQDGHWLAASFGDTNASILIWKL